MSDWVDALNSFANSWSSAMIRACWQGSLAIALVWAVCCAMPSMSPHIRCWLWRVAQLKLIIALFWQTPIDLPLLPPRPTSPVPGYAARSVESPSLVPISPGSGIHPAPTPSSTAQMVLPNAPSWFLLLWLLGVVWCGTRVASEWCDARRLRAACVSLHDERLEGFCEELCLRFGLRTAPRLSLSNDGCSPMLVGLIHPVVILPSSLLTDSTSAELRLMVAHELAHLKRRDLLWAWLPTAVQGLFSFHPLVWLARREWRLAQ